MARICACARAHTTRMRVATNRAGILLAIMRPGQLKTMLGKVLGRPPTVKQGGQKLDPGNQDARHFLKK